MSDSREVGQVADYDGSAVARRPASATSIPMEQQLEMMRTALTDPGVDPAKAREMFTLMREMQNDARQAEFNRSKIAAIRSMPAIYKRGVNAHLNNARYAKFEDLHRTAMPVLAANNLTLDFRIGYEGRNVTVQPILRHDNGYVEEGGVMASPPVEGNKGTNIAQTIAITVAYLKRHSFKAMLNIIEDGEDTDGSPREGDQLNDRQMRLLVDAQEAADKDEYAAFYGRLNVKDRSLLVSTGAHARLGGGKALPGPSPRDAAPEPEAALYDPGGDEPKAEPPPAQFDTSTPDGWTAKYEADCAAAPDRETLQRVQAKGAKGLERLKADHPKLHERAIKAGTDALARLSGDAGGGMFPGDE
ncbi:MAG: ERF family protein [Allosphingosinicella sp.]